MWSALRTPSWVARIVAIVGLVTLASSAMPGFRDRLALINQAVPDAFPAAAKTGAAAVGILLLLLSRALRRGKYRAWLYATVLVAIAATLHIIKGLDFEEAALCLALLVLLLASRENFTAKPDPRSLPRLGAVVIVGPLVATALGWLWLVVDGDGQVPGTTTWARIVHAFLGLMGITGPIHFVDPHDSARAAIALVVLGAAVVITALVVALQPAGGPHRLRDDERAQITGILDRWGGIDSLSYFALRDDRSVIFSSSGKAAITYRVVGSVSLAAGDPLGDPEAWPGVIKEWLAEAVSYGWVPAVLAASEQGAEAFHRAGLDALELGDEAIVNVDEFSLEGRSMRVVRQAVSRVTRSGITVTCHRVADLSREVLQDVLTKADAWRDGEVERGFSMALGRFGEARDDQNVVVLAHDADGTLKGLLHFVPWGKDGLSLDLMRRDREAENGVIETMVAGLMTAAPGLGVKRVSLNFAVFRAVFARGERLGAGPMLRLWRAVLLSASRFWQIESLYRANAKYQPEWIPRFICFRSSADLPRVGVAALRAEAFIVAPEWVKKFAKP